MATIYVTKWALRRSQVKINGRRVDGKIVRFDNAEVTLGTTSGAWKSAKVPGLYRNLNLYEFALTKSEAIAQVEQRWGDERARVVATRIKLRQSLERAEKTLAALDGIHPSNVKVVRGDTTEMGDLADLVSELVESESGQPSTS